MTARLDALPGFFAGCRMQWLDHFAMVLHYFFICLLWLDHFVPLCFHFLTFYICLLHGVSSWMSWLNDFATGLLACLFFCLPHAVSCPGALGGGGLNMCAFILFHRFPKWFLLLDALAVSFSNMCFSFPCHMCLHGCILFLCLRHNYFACLASHFAMCVFSISLHLPSTFCPELPPPPKKGT